MLFHDGLDVNRVNLNTLEEIGTPQIQIGQMMIPTSHPMTSTALRKCKSLELQSKPLGSPLINPIVLLYIVPYITPFQESR